MALARRVQPESLQERAAQEFAASLGARRRDAGAPVRTVFVADEGVQRPPLARLLSGPEGGGGGRGGQLRAKLYVSLLWVAAKEPYTVVRPARAWAALLGLPDVETNGVRRVQEALRDLQERRFIALEDRGGYPSVVTLLNETGDGSPFTPAPEAHNSLLQKKAGEAVLAQHRYFRVPTKVWTEGHIAQLTGPGFAMLLALLSENRGQDKPGVWFSPGRARERFGVADSTRRDGLRQLQQLGLVDTSKRVISERGTYIDFARRRNVHVITI